MGQKHPMSFRFATYYEKYQEPLGLYLNHKMDHLFKPRNVTHQATNISKKKK
jgi:hypothetical protein